MELFTRWKASKNGDIKKMMFDVIPFIFIFVVANLLSYTCRYLCDGKIIDGLNYFTQHFMDVVIAAPIISFNLKDLGIGLLCTFFLFLIITDKRANQKHFKKGTEHGSARWGTRSDIQPYIEKTSYWLNGVSITEKQYNSLDAGQTQKICGQNISIKKMYKDDVEKFDNKEITKQIIYRHRHKEYTPKKFPYKTIAAYKKRKLVKEENPNGTRNNIILSQTEFLTMNARPKDWTTGRNKNVLIVGGSGSGKTRYFIKPNIMQMHSSYIITDPKGTIINELGTMLKLHGYEIKVFNLINFEQSMRYNPMAYIHEEQDILKLVEVIMKNTTPKGANSSDPFWDKAEKLLYQALIGMIVDTFPPEERNLNTLALMIGAMEVRENDESFKNAIDMMFDDLKEEKPNCFAVQMYDKYKLAAGKTAKSILISCASRLAPFSIPKLVDLCKTDEMDLTSIGEKKTALFIIIPDTDATFNFLVAIMYTQLFNLLCTLADQKYGGRLPIHVRCMLDEFANIGTIPDFEKLIATIRSREISASIVLQTKSQLKSIYKDDADTIIGNCDTSIFLGGKEEGTTKSLVEDLGKMTIDDYNTSDTRGTSLSKGLNYSKLGRDLLTRDELETMDKRKCIVQITGIYPFFSNKYDIEKHPMFKYTADGFDDKNWFDVKKYINSLPGHRTFQASPKKIKAIAKKKYYQSEHEREMFRKEREMIGKEGEKLNVGYNQ